MRTKILTLALICLFVFASCNSPADPEIEKALTQNPDDYNPWKDTAYACKIEAAASVNTAIAYGHISLWVANGWGASNQDIVLSPLSDNPSMSEGAISFWKIIPPGTYKLIFRINHVTLVIEDGYPAPSLWTVRMNVSSSNQGLIITDGVQEASFSAWDEGEWGYQKTFTFSISE